ncbi:hypothetical protein PtA15_1A613 [Puccinia triticina]|uniref:Uncharacterized protein n=2 Tax=Puccinia triticina TaxID=208348 RepID=A0ABY7C8P9_9BASI|nr:uncharacterized protein PtA15_1A613 [Puccinia triticina]WAQ81273.1 hypothetical protein PtA15_1A613 [Puccinia triticina]
MLLLANAYSTCPLGTLPHSAALSAPKRLAQALQTLSQSLQSTEEPLLVFKRSGNQRLQSHSISRSKPLQNRSTPRPKPTKTSPAWSTNLCSTLTNHQE